MSEKQNNYPTIISLNPTELIAWCNKRKKEMGLSNAKLSLLSNVPEGTLDRILTGKNPEFRYSTIQPLIRILIGINDETPVDESNEYYTETIEGYKLIVENKNHIIDNFKQAYSQLQNELEYLKKSNDEKQIIIENLQQHTKWMEKQIDTK